MITDNTMPMLATPENLHALKMILGAFLVFSVIGFALLCDWVDLDRLIRGIRKEHKDRGGK